jgi:hypothetical protein
MTKTSVLAALPLILALGSVPSARAQPAHAGWRNAYDGFVVIPHNADDSLQMRGPRWVAPAPVPSRDHMKDPFADLHFE